MASGILALCSGEEQPTINVELTFPVLHEHILIFKGRSPVICISYIYIDWLRKS